MGSVCVASRATSCLRALVILFAALVLQSCATAPDARYPSRKSGCAVKAYPAGPSLPVEELGAVSVDCDPGASSCDRELLDAVCARGGDVAWGLADNSIGAGHLVAHAAHSKRALEGPREPGCSVRVFADAPPMPTENVGTVTAFCAEDDSKDVCLRELEDQVCQLGGDVMWQLEGPTAVGNKQRMRGRAAHVR
jgi:hypothetical protein